jgi:class 3 adenylate cyclase
MEPIRYRDAVTALAIALVCGVLAASPALDLLRGLSIDALTGLRWRTFGARHDPASSPVVVIGLDEESYRTPPFKGSPLITWSGEIGRVITATIDGGARVIGLDVVFPTSIEESDIPFGDTTVGARMRGFDRDFLRALAVPARAGKVILGEVQDAHQPILPAAGQRAAVGQPRNIRALNVYSDADEVVRRVPLTLIVGGRPVPGMALELAARALGVEPEIAADQSVTLADYHIPALTPNTMTVNFEGGVNDIPTYSLADLRACAERGDADFFRRAFDGKVVLVGSALDFEDRKLTSKRFATMPAGPPTQRCALLAPPSAAVTPNTINGVYVHATAINNLIRREVVSELGRAATGAVATAFAAIAALAALALTPVLAVVSFIVLALAWTVGATVAFEGGLVLPLFPPFAAGVLALITTTAFRLVVTDKDKRFLRKSFALYLPPAVIEKLVASKKPPALGGETRTVTVFFSDVAGFSSFSEAMKPAEIVALMNRYLSAMTDVIEEHGGFVDKYIGDAIMAVFGAPVEAANHATDAVRAALHCCERHAELRRSIELSHGPMFTHRIGLNSGQAVVGNIGSRQRFNYTAIGDSVNVASRLEGANKYFGTSILVSETTFALTGSAFVWRELDAIRVKGRAQPLKIYEPLAEAGRQSAEQTAHAAAYAAGLKSWRSRDFATAVEHFARVASADPPSALFLERAKRLMLARPNPDWEPIYTLEQK